MPRTRVIRTLPTAVCVGHPVAVETRAAPAKANPHTSISSRFGCYNLAKRPPRACPPRPGFVSHPSLLLGKNAFTRARMFCLREGRGATRNSNRVLRRVGPGERRNVGVLYEVLMSALFIIGMAESLLNRTVSRSISEPVSRRATLATLLTVRPASDFADCSATPVRTFGWSVCINTVTLQHPNVASGSQKRPKGGAGGPADPWPGHVGVFGGVLISQRRPTRRGWDGERRRPILVRKQRGWTPLLGGAGTCNCP